MALFEIDVLGFIAKLKHETNLFRWASLVFQMGLSAAVTFLFVTGVSLEAHAAPVVAIGRGMWNTAIVLSVMFGRSDLTRGMFLVRPAAETQKELETDLAITQRNPKL